jgi:hypothetical protein
MEKKQKFGPPRGLPDFGLRILRQNFLSEQKGKIERKIWG